MTIVRGKERIKFKVISNINKKGICFEKFIAITECTLPKSLYSFMITENGENKFIKLNKDFAKSRFEPLILISSLGVKITLTEQEELEWNEDNIVYIDIEDGTEIGYLEDVYNLIGGDFHATICKDEDFFIFVNNNEYAEWECDYTEEEAIKIAEMYGW